MISTKGSEANLDKINCMLSWPLPPTLKSLRGFLGLADYCCKFVQGYRQITQPLTQLLKKDAFTWSNDARRAFEQLWTTMTKVPVLAIPDFSHSINIPTNIFVIVHYIRTKIGFEELKYKPTN